MRYRIETLDDLSRILPEIVAGRLVVCDAEDVSVQTGSGDQPPRGGNDEDDETQ